MIRLYMASIVVLATLLGGCMAATDQEFEMEMKMIERDQTAPPPKRR